MACIVGGKGTFVACRGRGSASPPAGIALPVESALSVQLSERRFNAGSGWPGFRGYEDVVANRGLPAHQPERTGRHGGALSEEMAFTEQYIAIEKTRLGDRLQVELTIAPDTLDAMVPGMLLQPLVENAVRHGVACLAEGGKIAIASGLHEGRLRIIVRNSGREGLGKHEGSENGIGSRNISERLRTLYGKDHQFWLEWPKCGGCVVTVELPVRRIKPQEVSPC